MLNLRRAMLAAMLDVRAGPIGEQPWAERAYHVLDRTYARVETLAGEHVPGTSATIPAEDIATWAVMRARLTSPAQSLAMLDAIAIELGLAS